jgi:hypothetical protein
MSISPKKFRLDAIAPYVNVVLCSGSLLREGWLYSMLGKIHMGLPRLKCCLIRTRVPARQTVRSPANATAYIIQGSYVDVNPNLRAARQKRAKKGSSQLNLSI